jgi:protein ImuA
LTRSFAWEILEQIENKNEEPSVSVGNSAVLALRRQVAKLDRADASLGNLYEPLSFGIGAIDRMLGGGLALGALHEVAPIRHFHLGAAAGFAIALAAQTDADKSVLWIQPDFASLEGGSVYGPGLALLGLPLNRFLMLRVARSIDVLWAMEEALKSGALSTVIAELPEDLADLTMTRRLVLAARDGGTLGLLFRHQSTSEPNASMTRWDVASATGDTDAFGGLGAPAFDLSLVKNRRGTCGRWTVSWDQHERTFKALSGDLAAMASSRAGDARRISFG